MAVSIYTIYQLHKLEDITNSILLDNTLIDAGAKLSADYLSMRGFEQKFIITKDEAFLTLFNEKNKVFANDLEAMRKEADTPELANRIRDIEQHFAKYQLHFKDETKYLQSGEDYPKELLEQEKTQAEKEITNDLAIKLGDYAQERKKDKFNQLIQAEGKTIKAALGITVSSLVFIVAISILITINITRPLSAIKKRTREIASGDFGGHVKPSSPPEIKELVQAFNTMSTRLKEIDTMKTDFFALMSHELRTPLASIKEGINLLRESLYAKEITEKQRRLFAITQEENNRLITLVDSLLDLSKMESGMMAYAFNKSDLVGLITRAVREIEPLAEAKNIAITIETDKRLPRIKVDSERILQAMRNLLGNAVKFTPAEGQVRVSVYMSEQGVKVSVADTGVGIAKESLITIFDKFQQDVLTHSHTIKGTGLGLSIVKHIIKAHGGRIWAESAPGRGSIFTFVLPV